LTPSHCILLPFLESNPQQMEPNLYDLGNTLTSVPILVRLIPLFYESYSLYQSLRFSTDSEA